MKNWPFPPRDQPMGNEPPPYTPEPKEPRKVPDLPDAPF